MITFCANVVRRGVLMMFAEFWPVYVRAHRRSGQSPPPHSPGEVDVVARLVPAGCAPAHTPARTPQTSSKTPRLTTFAQKVIITLSKLPKHLAVWRLKEGVSLRRPLFPCLKWVEVRSRTSSPTGSVEDRAPTAPAESAAADISLIPAGSNCV